MPPRGKGRGRGRGRGRGQAPTSNPVPPPRSLTPPPRSLIPSDTESEVLISNDDKDEALFSPLGRSTIDDSRSPTPSGPALGRISSMSGLRCAFIGVGKKKNRPLRPIIYLRYIA
jgi:hypothetical protein